MTYKNIITAILAIAIIVVVYFGYKHYQQNNSQNKPVIRAVLTQEQKTQLQNKLDDLKNQVSKFDDNTDVTDKFTAYLEMSRVQTQLGMFKQAKDSLDKVAQGNENNPRIWEQYGRIYAGMGDLEQAKINMKRSLDIFGNNVGLWKAYLEVIRSNNGSQDDINSTYAQAVNATNNIDIITDYAKFLEQIGKKDGAIYYWQKAEEINPDKKADYENEINRLKAS